jgi:hypothetical protein
VSVVCVSGVHSKSVWTCVVVCFRTSGRKGGREGRKEAGREEGGREGLAKECVMCGVAGCSSMSSNDRRL